MARRPRAAAAALSVVVIVIGGLVASARPAAAIIPADITTCSNSTGSQVPRISSVKTCSSVSIVSTSAAGFSYASSRTSSAALVSAAGACGDAVSDGVGAICGGLDPGTAIIAAAQVCANALAALYSRGASGALNVPGMTPAELLNPFALSKLKESRQGYYEACAGSCNNAQSAAEALAQGAACGASAATGGCVAVTAEVRGEVFSRAFASVAADSWTKACAKGAGAALSGTETMAASAAAAFASAIARVAARACGSCPTCKCKALPGLGVGLNAAGRWQATFSTFAGGKVGLAKALARASGAMCRGGKASVTQAATEGTMAAVAGMVGGAAGRVHARALRVGGGEACSANTLATQFEAMKSASTRALSDAASSAFGGWCPAAAAKLQNVTLLSADTIARAAERSVGACSSAAAAAGGRRTGLFGGLPKLPLGVSQSDKIVAQLVLSDAPIRKKVTDALTEAKRCGCPPSLCLWCARAEKVAVPDPPSVVAPSERGGDAVVEAAAADPHTAQLFKALGYI